MMTPQQYADTINKFWEANRANMLIVAEQCFREHQLPPSAPILMPNLSNLLADIQKRSFFMGAIAILNHIDKANGQPNHAPDTTPNRN